MDFRVPLRGQFRYLSQLLRINQQLSGCSGDLTIPHQCVVIIIIILKEFVKEKIVKVKEQNLSASQATDSKGSKPRSIEVLSFLSLPFKRLCENDRVQDHDDAQHNAVPAKGLEIVLADIAHEELDGKDRDHKGHDHPH